MKIQLLRVPHFFPGIMGSHRIKTPYLPSLGMAQVIAYLKRKDFEVEQDDLNIKFHTSRFVKDVNKDKPDRLIIRKNRNCMP